MAEIIRNLKIQGSTPRSRRPSNDDDETPYVGPHNPNIIGRLTIASAPKEQPEGESCNAWHPQRPWSKQKKKAVLNLVGKMVVNADPVDEVDDE